MIIAQTAEEINLPIHRRRRRLVGGFPKVQIEKPSETVYFNGQTDDHKAERAWLEKIRMLFG